MKTALFLGAGFSAPFGLPVMNQFFSVAGSSAALDEPQRQFLQAVLRFAYSGSNFVSVQRDNLEAILSFLIMAEQLGIEPTQISISSHLAGNESPDSYLRRILAKIYGPLRNLEAIQESGDHFCHLLGMSDPNELSAEDLTIITTNYDLIAETMMLYLHNRVSLPEPDDVWVSSSGRSREQDNPSSLYDIRGKAKICKLHGSVNWMEPPGEHRGRKLLLEQRCGNMVEFSGSGFGPGMYTPHASLKKYYHEATEPPLIVPPTLFKHHADPRFRPIWGAAAAALRSAERILFVGYSFPESDTYMRYFLGASLAENVNLRTVAIFDLHADDICSTLEKDSRYGGHFKQLLRPVNGDWTKISPGAVLAR